MENVVLKNKAKARAPGIELRSPANEKSDLLSELCRLTAIFSFSLNIFHLALEMALFMLLFSLPTWKLSL